MLRRHIALWDVIACCDIVGSGDSSIRNVVANDLQRIILHAPVERILLNGQTAGRLFEKHCGDLNVPYDILPSTSPANARWTVDALVQTWGEKLKGE